MEDIREKKIELRAEVEKVLDALDKKEVAEKTAAIEARLFEFANFLEAKIAMLYVERPHEVRASDILRKSAEIGKIIILPIVGPGETEYRMMKIDHMETDLKQGEDGLLCPDMDRCKTVPIECIDIALIPGIVFDEKGGRIGQGQGCYNQVIQDLPITTRKVALALEEQIVAQVPMESSDRFVDIIITDKRIIYKI